MKIIIAGPPRSGKSCFREGLKQAIKKIPGAPYPYVITGCPDGEGAWFQETINNHPEVAQACKNAYKSKFTPEFVSRIEQSVKNCALPITLVDIGGIVSDENKAICKHASHAIILAGDKTKVKEWEDFFSSLNISILAVIHSDYNGKEDIVGVSVHHLERGEDVSNRPTIKWLAEKIVKHTNS